jgi:hypothetical protein
LALLFALEEQRGRVLESAKQCLGRGEWERARAIAKGAAALRDGKDAARFQAVCYLLRRDFSRAFQAYVQASDSA